ncbi:hypothetical protein ACOZ4N_15970 [Halorientalis pallida]|uniref:hypothetical protein n=1 Tax=Halorientalis pallida TaxID=2479928 RepID=UPI003C703D07
MTELTNWTHMSERSPEGVIKSMWGLSTWRHNEAPVLQAMYTPEDLLFLTVEPKVHPEEGDDEGFPVEVFRDISDEDEAEEKLAEINAVEVLADSYVRVVQKAAEGDFD